MSRIKVRRQIEIERNLIEQMLLKTRDFLMVNRKIVLYSFIAVLFISAGVIAAVVFVGNINEKNLKEFEKITESYREYTTEEEKLESQDPKTAVKDEAAEKAHKEKIKGIISDLKKFIDSSSFGYAHNMAYYVLGNIYFSEKMYKEAHAALEEYADSSSSSPFGSLALLKAGIAADESGDAKGAIAIFEELEKKHSDSAVADQIFYQMGVMYQKKGDMFKAKEYYNKVVSGYPMSPFLQKAKKRLFLLGLAK
jgi:TolA-binding protein